MSSRVRSRAWFTTQNRTLLRTTSRSAITPSPATVPSSRTTCRPSSCFPGLCPRRPTKANQMSQPIASVTTKRTASMTVPASRRPWLASTGSAPGKALADGAVTRSAS